MYNAEEEKKKREAQMVLDEIELKELWVTQKVKEVVFTYECGNDDFGEMETEITAEDDDKVNKTRISELIDRLVFKKCTFYEVSSGSYIGESGTVTITLDENNELQWVKDAQGEFEENELEEVNIPLSKEEIEFIKEYISVISGDCSFNDTQKTFSKDFILTDEIRDLLESIDVKIVTQIRNKVYEYAPPYEYDEVGENATFSTIEDWNNEDEPIQFFYDCIKFFINITVYRFEKADW